MKKVGVLLLVIGIGMTVFTGFTLLTRKKVVDLGAVEISKTEKTPIYWSPITGIVLAATGLILFLSGRRKIN